jgi:hypothetical protein
MPRPQRIKLIACDILFRELSHGIAHCRSIVEATFMPKGLHDIGAGPMSARLQEAIAAVDPTQFDAIALGYALCNNGIVGLRAPLPLVVPRAHDCITLLLGSKERYADYFAANPGTYFYSSGWVERNKVAEGLNSISSQMGLDRSFQELVAKFGEENAQYIAEVLLGGLRHYKKLAFIDTGLGDRAWYDEYCAEVAAEHGWETEVLEGDTGLLTQLLDGAWDDARYLVTPPGQTIEATGHDDILCAACPLAQP